MTTQKPLLSFKERALRQAERLLEAGSEAAEVLVHLQANPTPAGFLALGLRAASAYRDATKSETVAAFAHWRELDRLRSLDKYLYEMCKKHFPVEVLSANTDQKALVFSVHGARIGWYVSDGSAEFGPVIPEQDSDEEAFAALGRAVWEDMGGSCCRVVVDDDSKMRITSEDLGDALPSETARHVLERCERFLSHGFHRSVMFYGEPGVGKTCMMRWMASQRQGFVMRLSLDDIEEEGVVGVALLLRPRTMLIDDIDRLADGGASILTTLERLRDFVELLLVSANDVDSLDRALIRAGRFDDLIEVTHLDPDLVAKLIGNDVPAEHTERLSLLPVAYLEEFRRRREVLGIDQAVAEIEELAERADQLTGAYEEAEDE